MHRRVVQTVAAAWKWNDNQDVDRDYAGLTPSTGSGGTSQIQTARSSNHSRDLNLRVQTSFPRNNTSTGSAKPRTTTEHSSSRRMSSPGGQSFASLSSLDENDHRLRTSPESIRPSTDSRRSNGSLQRVPEEGVNDEATVNGQEAIPPEDEENEEYEWELQELGLYTGSYKRFIALYTFVPLTALLTFVVLAILPPIFWPASNPHSHTRYFPSPLPEFLLSASLFSFSHLLRLPLYYFCSYLLYPFRSTWAVTVLNAALHVVLSNFLRLAALMLLNVRHSMDFPYPTWKDSAFGRVWWLSLNIAELVIAIVQGYEQVGLYRDVMVPAGRAREFVEMLRNGEVVQLHGPGKKRNGYGAGQVFDEPLDIVDGQDTVQVDAGRLGFDFEASRDAQARTKLAASELYASQIDRDFDQLMELKAREELEEVYGVPVINIPIPVFCLLRFNSIILSVGLTLLLSASYLRSSFSLPTPTTLPPASTSNRPLFITLPIILLVHTALAVLHTPLVLPRIGVHTAAYIGVLVGLTCFFAGLGVWEVLS